MNEKNEILYHGSPHDIQDEYLKPLGWSYHLKQNALYLTESRLMAASFALFWRKQDGVKELSFYDLETKHWKAIYILKTPDVLRGYIYEAEKPNVSPVEYIDEQTGDTFAEYKQGAKAIFAVTEEVQILKKQIVDYNYLKIINFPAIIVSLKKQYDFKQATQKIEHMFNEIDKTSDDKEKKNKYMQVLETYTERQ